LLQNTVTMKRFLGILLFVFVLNACDDGDLQVENIDFEEITANRCPSKDVVYKIKDSEMLLMEIPIETSFLNEQTPENSPITLPISSTVKVKYRQYNGTVSADNICPTIPDANPSLQEEWNAVAGTIQITTTTIKSTNETTGLTKITGYRHYIVFKNITFEKPTGVQTYETYVFGNYNTTAATLPLGFDDEAQKSSCDNRVFNISGSELLMFDTENYSTLFENSVTTTPRIALINSSNKLSYKLYNNVVMDTYLCSSPIPTTPTLLQEWNAVDGVENVSGIIEVTTSTYGTGFQHTVRLKNVTLKKGNNDFTLGSDYLFGSFIVNP
jgi:hypothetical protein